MKALGDLKIILIFAKGIMHWTSIVLSKTVLMIMDYHGHEKMKTYPINVSKTEYLKMTHFQKNFFIDEATFIN